MKHVNFMYVAIVALFIQSAVANARVEGEFSGSESYELSGGGSTVWGEPAPVDVAPVAVQTAPQTAPAILPAAAPKTAQNQLAYAPAAVDEYGTGNANVLTTAHAEKSKSDLRITPMVGSGDYVGPWNINVKNNISLGLATEFLTDSPFTIEIEGGYSNYSLAYTSLAEPMAGYAMPRLMAHKYDQFTLGANAKYYLSRGTFRPFVGGGFQGVYYAGMQQRLPGDYIRSYDDVVGSAQALAGADVGISRTTSVGIRGSWVVPVLHKPMTRDNGRNSAPGFEEAALIGTSYYKILGTVSVDL